LLINTKTGIHTHLKNTYGCSCVKIFIQHNITPDDEYLRESIRRLTLSRREAREQYINIPIREYKLNYI